MLSLVYTMKEVFLLKDEGTSVRTVKLQILDSGTEDIDYDAKKDVSREESKEGKTGNELNDLRDHYLKSLPAFLDVRRFAKEIGVSEPSAYKFIQSKKVRFFRVGTQIRIPREAMIELAMGCTKDGEIDEGTLSKYDL